MGVAHAFASPTPLLNPPPPPHIVLSLKCIIDVTFMNTESIKSNLIDEYPCVRVFLKLFFGLSNNIKIVVVYPTILILKIASDFYHLIILKLALFILTIYCTLWIIEMACFSGLEYGR